MATNDFLVFGGGAGANVMTQADWAALAARTAGFSSGVAQSAQLNKAWRQSSVMSAVLAQLIADVTGQDVVDDGTVATILTNLKAAVKAQSPGVVGDARNLRMSVTAASSTATITADELIVQDALGGKSYVLGTFSQNINLATNGAGGMDTGSPPNNGFVAIYAGYNPTTNTRTLFGQNATASAAPEVYGGANAPAGITATSLASVWPTNGSGQLIVGCQLGRWVSRGATLVLGNGTIVAAFTSLGISSAVPANAKRARLILGGTNLSASTFQVVDVASNNSGVGQQSLGGGGVASVTYAANGVIDLLTPQTLFYRTSNTGGGTPTFNINVSAYEI